MNYLAQINISKGGVPKRPIPSAKVFLEGIDGDIQKDKRYHGGPDRAICLFSMKLIDQLKAEGHSIYPGSTGENLSIFFDQYETLVPGVKLLIGNELKLEITSYAAPCKTIKSSFLNGIFIRISQKVFPNESRLYARVLQEGTINVGDSIQIVN
jgi:MOSC domain-containing protein YiiM